MDQTELGNRLRIAREARGLSQQAVADAMDVPRTAITHMEKANRSVSTLELTRLARLYRRPLTYFFEESVSAEQDEDALFVLHRAMPGVEMDPEIQDEVRRCLDLCREGIALEAALGKSIRSGPPAYEMAMPRTAGEAVTQGEDVAAKERNRLGMGVFPIPDLAEIIGAQGIWASSLVLPNRMSGLFMQHPSIGFAILVNASHVRGRKRFSYAHEYAHALMDRNHDVTISSADNSSDLVEKRANAFAASFLVPKDGVYEVMKQYGKGYPSRQKQVLFDVAGGGQIDTESRTVPGSQRITYKDVVNIAHHFGVSYRAALFRLRNLGYVQQSEWDGLLQNEDFGRQYLKLLNLSDSVEKKEHKRDWNRELRSEIVHLAIEAYRREEISVGRLHELSKSLNIEGPALLELAEVARGD